MDTVPSSWEFSKFLLIDMRFVASGAVETYHARGSYYGLPECDCTITARVVNDKIPKWEIARHDHYHQIYSWSPLAKSLTALRHTQTAWNYSNAKIERIDDKSAEYYTGVTIGSFAITLRRIQGRRFHWYIVDNYINHHNLKIHAHRADDLEEMRGSVATDLRNRYAEKIISILIPWSFPVDCFPRVKWYLFAMCSRPLIREEMIFFD